MSKKNEFRRYQRQDGVAGSAPPEELTWGQDWAFWKNFSWRFGAFPTPEARKAAWDAHKNEYMREFEDSGVRPGAWWEYESGITDLPKFMYRGNPGHGGPDEYVDELEFLVGTGFASRAEISDFKNGRIARNYREK